MMRTTLIFFLLFTVPAAAPAAEPPPRHVIPDVEPVSGPDPMVRILARILRIAVDPGITDDDLYGLTGAAFLSTVCANNCTCRDFRELTIAVQHGLAEMGVSFEHFEEDGPEVWKRIKRSVADGVPVLAWNLFGDYEDGLLTGYDEEKDLVRGWGVEPSGEEYREASLSKWRSGGLFGFIVERGEIAADRKALEDGALALIVRRMRRPPLEGG